MNERSQASFRDPDGHIFFKDGEAFRKVKESYREDYKHLMDSGLYEELVEEGLMVGHEEIEDEESYKTLKPEQIDFISYPYEWSFSQLKDAALLTLEIQKKASEHGMTLKDANTYNVQFQNGEPVFIDTLSFEKKESESWNGYRQFCKHFLAPLALMKYTDTRLLQLMKNHIDGIPLDLASKLLPKRTKLRLGLNIHIHMHSRFQNKYGDANEAKKRELSDTMAAGILRNLETTVKKLEWRPEGTEWSDYYENTNYSEEGFKQKERLVETYTREVRPDSIWDFGANNGYFSRIAAETADALTLAFDLDPAAVEKNYRRCREEENENVLPLVQDFTNPSPGIGWENSERETLPDRGDPDLGVALALLHHLAISNNLPLERISEFFADKCPNLIIEFVPKNDSNAQKLLTSREDIFGEYDRENFEAEFSEHYSIEERKKIKDSERTLYLMRRK